MHDWSPVTGKLTRLRRARDEDVERIAGWLADPETGRYWDWGTFTRDDLGRDGVVAWIVETLESGTAIGYLQTHADGIDMFLVPAARGRGLGPDAARAMAEHLLAGGRRRVTVDPYEWNDAAVRAWERAGFVEVSRGHPPDDDHSAEWVLMEYRR
jgi:aminoglycoside 6'-N-acetyltransferase